MIKVAWCTLVFLILERPLFAQMSSSISIMYVSSGKVDRFRDNEYYFDYGTQSGYSIQAELLCRILQFSQSQNKKLHVEFGISGGFITLPYKAKHFVNGEYIGSIGGIEQWVYYYQEDVYRFRYLLLGPKLALHHFRFGYVALSATYPFQIGLQSNRRDLFINNKTGENTWSPKYHFKSTRDRNPIRVIEVETGLKMMENIDFIIGFQWMFRSSILLTHTGVEVDNREGAFRNLNVGWRWRI